MLCNIGLKQDKATFEATTQGGVRSAIMLFSWLNQSDQIYYLKQLQDQFATEALSDDIKSLHGNTCCQVYSYKASFLTCLSQLNAKEDNIGEYLDNFLHDFGAPEHLTVDEFGSQVGKNTRFFKNLCK